MRILFKTLKIKFGPLCGRLFGPSTFDKCGFRVGWSSFLRFSCFLLKIIFSNDFLFILDPLGALFGRPCGVPKGVLEGILGALGASEGHLGTLM